MEDPEVILGVPGLEEVGSKPILYQQASQVNGRWSKLS